MEMTLMMVLIFVVFYFLMIRPQVKRAKEHKKMVDALQKGDEVVTAGGEVGRVVKVADAYVTLEIAENVSILLQKTAVQTLLPKGTIKSIE
ncbi:MAG TPA: preprotein translocase subunit YajC [Burkholderiales bacterium]|nr:preprotein translocase subunit YajC [Burkholderiales bacterium]